MTHLELEDWKIARTHGWGKYIVRMTGRRCLMFFIPVAVIFLLAHWCPGKDEEFLENNPLLIRVFAAITLLIGFGEGVFGWLIREREYALETGFLDRLLTAIDTLPITGDRNEFSLKDLVDDPEENVVDATLILEARRIQTAHARSSTDLDEQCAKFDPIFRAGLVEDTFRLAAIAGVCEKAAFLALMSQFEN